MTPRSARDMEAKKMDDDCCRAGPAMRATSTRMLVRKETEMISENTSPDRHNILSKSEFKNTSFVLSPSPPTFDDGGAVVGLEDDGG